MLKDLASEEDVAEIIDLYHECFSSSPRDSSQLETQVPTIAFDFRAYLGGGDPGVEVEATMPSEVLCTNLGFVQSRPLLFNSHKHRGGATPWDDRGAFREAATSNAFTPNVLHWHQIAGVHAILRRLLSKKSSKSIPGILIADEVGLGKTLQSLATISWLTECVGRQKKTGITLPPIYSKPLDDLSSVRTPTNVLQQLKIHFWVTPRRSQISPI